MAEKEEQLLIETEEPKELSPSEDPNNVLVIEDLKKSYADKDVLMGINLEVHKGEVFGFIGKNGAGKSTTIDCIVGLKEPTSGKIYVCNNDIELKPLEAKKCIGYVSSEPTAYEMMTGKDYLEFIGSSYGMFQETFDKNMAFIQKKFKMPEEDLNRRISGYSHGMKQKICLMASLVHNPKIWIMDEPTVGLDIIVYQTLIDMIQEFARNGKTVFITSHDIDLVTKVCDRVAIINNGVVSELIDFKANPMKRRDLARIFFSTYGEE